MKRRVGVWAVACAALIVVAVVVACGGSSSPPIADAGSSSGSTSSTSSSSSSSSSGSTGTGTGTSSGSTQSDSGVVNELNKCQQASDCAWGEIDKEILSKKDCMCLFGCPHLPLNKTTVRRREEQFKNLCDGNTDGSGRPCPIDDCARPGDIECRNGICAAPSRDGGGNQM